VGLGGPASELEPYAHVGAEVAEALAGDVVLVVVIADEAGLGGDAPLDVRARPAKARARRVLRLWPAAPVRPYKRWGEPPLFANASGGVLGRRLDIVFARVPGTDQTLPVATFGLRGTVLTLSAGVASLLDER
jgi:hypothetical protein